MENLTLTERDILFCALHEYVLVLETYTNDARAMVTRDLISKLSVLL